MKSEIWPEDDYDTAMDFLIDHEELAVSNTLLHTDKSVGIILPKGLPLYGAGFYSIFMLAPIIVFMLFLTYFLFAFLTADSVGTQTLILISGGCLFLIWGLVKALQLLVSSRDLFPRKYFSTMGKHGIATHYSKFHFLGSSKTAIAWKDVKTTQVYSTPYLPGLLAGKLQTWFIEISSKAGNKIKIPVSTNKNPSTLDLIVNYIDQKYKSQ